jgi:CRP-like cAMP-binding protein
METDEQLAAMFPKLDDAQIARLGAFGSQRHAEPGEMLFDRGDTDHGVFVVLAGRIEVDSVWPAGRSPHSMRWRAGSSPAK